MTIKNLNIEEYLLGRCDAQQMHELATCVAGSSKRLRLLFALRCAFLDLKYQHHFDDANLIATAEQRLFDTISKGWWLPFTPKTTYKLISSSTYQPINLPTQKLINTPTYKPINLQTHQLTNLQTHQLTNLQTQITHQLTNP